MFQDLSVAAQASVAQVAHIVKKHGLSSLEEELFQRHVDDLLLASEGHDVSAGEPLPSRVARALDEWVEWFERVCRKK
ncbi:MAG: hypothetical protein QG621_422 [Patescibacteria group bacterium]|jgi:hypothetical protein|nr:hypothetical protein [Patescibacteria group bacterium]